MPAAIELKINEWIAARKLNRKVSFLIGENEILNSAIDVAAPRRLRKTADAASNTGNGVPGRINSDAGDICLRGAVLREERAANQKAYRFHFHISMTLRSRLY